MSLRAFGVIAAAAARRITRGPLILVAIAVFAGLAFAMPRPDVRDPGEIVRDRVAFLLSAGGGILMCSSVILGLPRAARRTRFDEARLVGPRTSACAQGVAALVVLLVLASGFAVTSFLTLGMMPGGADPVSGAAPLREVAARNPAPVVLAPGGSPLVFGGDGGWGISRIRGARVLLELHPRVRFHAAEGSSPAFDLSWIGGDGRERRRRVACAGDRTIEENLDLGEGGRLRRLSIAVVGKDVSVAFDRGTVVLLGLRAQLLGALVRAFFVLGLGAATLALFTQWMTGFVSAPIALASAFTAVLCALVLPRLLPWPGASGLPLADLLPGFGATDPVAVARGKGAMTWEDLIVPAARAAAWLAFASVAAWLERRVEPEHGP